MLIYLTTTLEKEAKKIKTWEESRLSDDKLLVATRLFRCYILDEELIPKDDPFTKSIKKHRAPSFLVLHGGDLLYGSGKKPASSKLFSVLKSSVSKVYGKSLDKIVKEGLKIKKEMDKIKDARTILSQKLSKLDAKDKRRKKYEEEMSTLDTEEAEWRAKEEKLYDLTAAAGDKAAMKAR